MIKFNQKEYSVLSDSLKGASLGLVLGGGGKEFINHFPQINNRIPQFFNKKRKDLDDKLKENKKELDKSKDNAKKISDSYKNQKGKTADENKNIELKFEQKTSNSLEEAKKKLEKERDFFENMNSSVYAAGGMIIGAALGALVGMLKNASRFKNGSRKELIKDVVLNLRKMNFKEDYDFTVKPKIADNLKTRVTLLINRGNAELKVGINSSKDPRLNKISSDIIKGLPTTSIITEKSSDRFNNIQVSTMSNNQDALFIASVAERFIKNGYKVYIIEVG